jgi:hypothetical protein
MLLGGKQLLQQERWRLRPIRLPPLRGSHDHSVRLRCGVDECHPPERSRVNVASSGRPRRLPALFHERSSSGRSAAHSASVNSTSLASCAGTSSSTVPSGRSEGSSMTRRPLRTVARSVFMARILFVVRPRVKCGTARLRTGARGCPRCGGAIAGLEAQRNLTYEHEVPNLKPTSSPELHRVRSCIAHCASPLQQPLHQPHRGFISVWPGRS